MEGIRAMKVLTRMAAMKASSHPRAALIYEMNVPSVRWSVEACWAAYSSLPYDRVVR